MSCLYSETSSSCILSHSDEETTKQSPKQFCQQRVNKPQTATSKCCSSLFYTVTTREMQIRDKNCCQWIQCLSFVLWHHPYKPQYLRFTGTTKANPRQNLNSPSLWKKSTQQIQFWRLFQWATRCYRLFLSTETLKKDGHTSSSFNQGLIDCMMESPRGKWTRRDSTGGLVEGMVASHSDVMGIAIPRRYVAPCKAWV